MLHDESDKCLWFISNNEITTTKSMLNIHDECFIFWRSIAKQISLHIIDCKSSVLYMPCNYSFFIIHRHHTPFQIHSTYSHVAGLRMLLSGPCILHTEYYTSYRVLHIFLYLSYGLFSSNHSDFQFHLASLAVE